MCIHTYLIHHILTATLLLTEGKNYQCNTGMNLKAKKKDNNNKKKLYKKKYKYQTKKLHNICCNTTTKRKHAHANSLPLHRQQKNLLLCHNCLLMHATTHNPHQHHTQTANYPFSAHAQRAFVGCNNIGGAALPQPPSVTSEIT